MTAPDDHKCPSENTVVEFISGGLSTDQAAAVEAHVDECPTCRAMLAEFVRADSLSRHHLVPESPGRYTVRQEYGRGGQSRVMLAFDETIGREVALKLLPDETTEISTEARLLREARIAGQLSHPNVVQVHEVGRRTDGQPFYTMQLIRGKTLSEVVADLPALSDRLKLLDHFISICNAVAYAHSRGVVHRDLKPQNIMVGEFGEAVLLDWGLAKVRGQPEVGPSTRLLDSEEIATVDGTAMGTPGYMSPEQARGDLEEIDERSDIYGLGSILYEIVGGQPPGRGSGGRRIAHPLRSVSPAAPPELVSIVDVAMSDLKSERYESATSLAEDVRAFLSRERVGSYRYTLLDGLKRIAKRHKTATVAVLIVSTVIMAALGAVTMALQAEKRQKIEATYRRGEALREGARAAFDRRSMLEARAKLREAFEIVDDPIARSLWRRLGDEPVVWQKKVGTYIEGVAFSPDDRYVAVGTSEGTIHLLDAQTGSGRVLRVHEDQVLAIDFTDRGGFMASGAGSGKILLWRRAELNAKRGTDSPARGPRSVIGHEGRVLWVGFAKDGRRLATGGLSSLRMWDVETMRLMWELPQSQYSFAGWHPDGKLIASTGAGEVIPLIDAESGAVIRQIQTKDHNAVAVAFSPDGTSLASGGREGRILLWDVATSALIRELTGHRRGISSLVFMKGGAQLATSGHDGAIRLWDVETGLELKQIATETSVQSIAVSSDDQLLAGGGLDGVARVWRTAVRPIRAAETAHTNGVNCVVFHPNGDLIAAGDYDGAIRIWDVKTGRQRAVYSGHVGTVRSLAYSPDGTLLASAGVDDDSVRIWDTASGRTTGVVMGPGRGVNNVSFDRDGRRLVFSTADGKVRVWNLSSQRYELPLGERRAHQAVYGPRGMLATSSDEWTVTVRQPGHKPVNLQRHRLQIEKLVFGSQGRLLASASLDETVRISNIETRSTRTLQVGARVYGVAFDPEGERLGASLSDGTVVIWQLATSNELFLRGHTSEVNDIAFSPDGALVATVSDDGTVRTWTVEDGRPFWRAPILDPETAELLTHEGWKPLAGRTRSDHRWRHGLDKRARLGSVSDSGEILCVATTGEQLEAWNLNEDELLFTRPAPDIHKILGFAGGCITLVKGDVRTHTSSTVQTIATGANDVAWANERVWVAKSEDLESFDKTGRLASAHPSILGATTVSAMKDQILVGFRDGSIETIGFSGEELPSAPFEHAPAAPVVTIVAGPLGTVLVGHANGEFGMWSLANGLRHDHGRLNGSITHMHLRDDRLIVASELGRHVVWDLSVFNRSYCEVLQEIWQKVSVVWEAGVPTRRAPGTGHRCHSR